MQKAAKYVHENNTSAKIKNMNVFHAHVLLLRFVLSEDVEQKMTGSWLRQQI